MELTLPNLLHLLRSAIGIPQLPPNQVLMGLSLFLSFFIMAPTWDRIDAEAIAPYRAQRISGAEALDRAFYGVAPRIRATTKLHQYLGYTPPLQGDLCELFPAEAAGDPVLLKVARLARNNDLLQAEAQALRKIDRTLDGQPARAHFPTLVEHFLLRDATGDQRHTNVLRAEAGYVSLAEVLQAYPSGLAPADAA